MSTVKRIAEEATQGLNQLLPDLNKLVVRKLSLAVGAIIEGQTPNTVELSNLLPLDTDRQDMREQWLRRLLKSPALRCETVMAPFAQAALKQAGQRSLFTLDCSNPSFGHVALLLAVIKRLLKNKRHFIIH